MIRVIIVDDELPAIHAMQYLLQNYSDIKIVGTYTEPEQLLVEVAELRPDVLFLDIEMRETTGLEVAEQLYEILPNLQIVFVTAYNEYAVSAFELGALDYLLKPVSESRIEKTIHRIIREKGGILKSSNQTETSHRSKAVLHIRCFGSLQLSIETAGTKEEVMLRTSKAEELFALFMHYYGRPVHKDLLIERLWPDLVYENATMQLHTAVYQVRKLLKRMDNGSELRYRHDRYHLTLTDYTYDVGRIKDLVKEAEVSEGDKLIDIVNQTIDIYVDDYLEGNGYVWSVEEGTKLSDAFHKLLLRAANFYIDRKQEKDAIQYLRLLIERNPLHEGYYRLLLSAYAGLHDYPSMKELYMKLVSTLEQELGEAPHPDTIAHYERLIGLEVK